MLDGEGLVLGDARLRGRRDRADLRRRRLRRGLPGRALLARRARQPHLRGHQRDQPAAGAGPPDPPRDEGRAADLPEGDGADGGADAPSPLGGARGLPGGRGAPWSRRRQEGRAHVPGRRGRRSSRQELEQQQEVLGHFADVAMETYALESAVLRTQKRAAAEGEETARLHEAAVRCFAQDALDRIESRRGGCWPPSTRATCSATLGALKRFTKREPREHGRAAAPGGAGGGRSRRLPAVAFTPRVPAFGGSARRRALRRRHRLRPGATPAGPTSPIVERASALGGLAGSFERDGHFYPLGYHHILAPRPYACCSCSTGSARCRSVRWRRIRMLFRLRDGRLYDLGRPADFLAFPMSLADKLRFVRLMLRAFTKRDWTDWQDRSAADARSTRGPAPGCARRSSSRSRGSSSSCRASEVSGAWLGRAAPLPRRLGPLGYIPDANWTKVLCDGVTRLVAEQGVTVRLRESVTRLRARGRPRRGGGARERRAPGGGALREQRADRGVPAGWCRATRRRISPTSATPRCSSVVCATRAARRRPTSTG